jgi:hypothetical protein
MSQISVVVKNGDNTELNTKLSEGWKFVSATPVSNHVTVSTSCGSQYFGYLRESERGDTLILVILESHGCVQYLDGIPRKEETACDEPFGANWNK